jgi:hypothetical protein
MSFDGREESDELPEFERGSSLGAMLDAFDPSSDESLEPSHTCSLPRAAAPLQEEPRACDDELDCVREDQFHWGIPPKWRAVGKWSPEITNGLSCQVTGHTDSEGWIYARHASEFGRAREGGRGRCRPTDFCRRRYWIPASGAAETGLQPASSAAADHGKKIALQSFFDAIMRRRGTVVSTWVFTPADITAWIGLERVHQKQYEEFVNRCPLFASGWAGDGSDAPPPALLSRLAVAMVYARAAYAYVRGTCQVSRRSFSCSGG